jgi:multiple sugar transport system ATP-binding protein
MAELKIENVTKSFGDVDVLRGINLHVKEGEFCVFVGPSGCGKSTLLRLICGLDEVSSGTLYIDKRDVTDVVPAKREIAMVFQSYALYPHMSVFDNMGFGLKLAKTDKAEIQRRVEEAARILQISHLLDRKPRALSGGQRQRVAIGRAIVRHPKIFLFDEPLSNLDAALRVDMRVEIARLKAELGATVIYVTHDQVEAMTLADKIVVLRDGRIEQVGAPLDLYHAPANLFVAGFIGSPRMNFLSATVEAHGAHAITARLSNGLDLTVPVTTLPARGESITLGLRPERLNLIGRGEGVLRGMVEVVEALGGETFAHIASDTGRVLLKLDGSVDIRRGQPVELGFSPDDLHVFDAQGISITKRHERVAA